ncbi:hypothetical protein HN588_10575, partial [Candidatus Bathyarchaeota archaeon]|nr:hypothetical protein [Candidatus Bathyarchaeota archaeon]
RYREEAAEKQIAEDTRRRAEAAEDKKWIDLGRSPDVKNYVIQDIEAVGNYLIIKVSYPNCSRCSYSGNKVLVVRATMKDAVMWNEIDPHFKDPKTPKSRNQSPGPIARFPASPEGWQDALSYARSKNGSHLDA